MRLTETKMMIMMMTLMMMMMSAGKLREYNAMMYLFLLYNKFPIIVVVLEGA